VANEINPYESPSTATDQLPVGLSPSLFFFLINFLGATCLALLLIVGIANSATDNGSPFEFLGGLCCVGPAAAMAIGEWLIFGGISFVLAGYSAACCWYRVRRRERRHDKINPA